VSVSQRVAHATSGNDINAYGPTSAQAASLQLARAQFTAVEEALRGEIEPELEALRRSMDAAAAPWTPGRGL
jgi:hypothetical protein